MICVNSVEVSPQSVVIEAGKWYYYVCATVCPANADCKSVTWHSSNTSVASVNPTTGYIRGVSQGTARIYATATDGSGCSDYLTVTVRNTVPVTSVTLNTSSISVERGSSVALCATVCPENATNKNVNWSSSNNSVATVSGGVVTAISNGSARITATAADGSGKSASCWVSVTGDILVTSIELTPSNTTLRVGYSLYPSVTVCPADATNKSVTWSSANSNIASVNPNSGLVYAKRVGVTTIYAHACDGSGVCGCCTVRVVPVYVQDITVCPETLTLDIGERACLEASVYPVNATNPNISWVSNDCNIADVDSNGCVTAKSAGTTCICAYATDGSGVHGCCEVTCNTLSRGTDSIGVFRTLSTIGNTSADAEAPVPYGMQCKELEDEECYSVRFVSQIRHLNYKCVGFEIHSKFGDNAPVSNVLSSIVAYESIEDCNGTIFPQKNEGYNYFVVDVVENVPKDIVASFKVKPFAIKLSGECVYGDTVLFGCENAQEANGINFETPAHLSTSSHIGHAELSQDKNNYTFTCAFSQCNTNFTVPKDQVIGSYVTSNTDSRLGDSQTPLAYGIDLSSHQGEISQSQWNDIANTKLNGQKITFVILRIGREKSNNPDGSINRVKDECFDENYIRAKAAGLHVGCYYLTESWSPQNAIADAEQVIEWIGDKQFEYPVFFDIESDDIKDNENVPNNTVRTEICTAFMNTMRAAGFFTGLYTNDSWIKDHLNSSTIFPEYDFWYARWYDDTPNNWGENGENNWAGEGRKFGMWQYAEEQPISPISGKVDYDVAYKNYPSIIKSLHLNNFK